MHRCSLLAPGMAVAIARSVGAVSADEGHAAQATKRLGCDDYLSVATPIGRLSNNVWNKGAAGKSVSIQCLEQRELGGALQFGWSWDWSAPSTTVYAYPAVIVGAKPWEPGPGTDARFPRRVSATQHMQISYEVETEATGGLNLATSLWLIRTPTVSTPPDLKAISTEIMIWTESSPSSFVPGGSKRGEIQIDGVTWEVWVAENWGDNSGANANHWTYIAYRSPRATRSISYDASKFIADAVARGMASPDHYIASVELGNEVMGGRGKTFIQSFSIDLD